MEKILYGKPVANLINAASRSLITQYNQSPKMLLIQVGSDPASAYYVKSIINSGKKLGCETELISLPADTPEDDLLILIGEGNDNPDIHGIMIQKPLPSHISENKVNLAISPYKDIDCIHPINLGKLAMEMDTFLPCTPAAVYMMMHYYSIDPLSKNVVIIGRSNVVGKPMANILLWKKKFANATVTVCHSRTSNLPSVTSSADIIIAAIGKANFVNSSMIKEGCILLDVGINEIVDSDNKQVYVGDIDYNDCFDKALAITPVPGGVGTVTTSILYLNLIKACLDSAGCNKTVDEYIALIFDANL